MYAIYMIFRAKLTSKCIRGRKKIHRNASKKSKLLTAHRLTQICVQILVCACVRACVCARALVFCLFVFCLFVFVLGGIE